MSEVMMSQAPTGQFLPGMLLIAALMQMMIALINLFLVRLLHWEEELARVPLLLRQVFYVHAWFISFVLAIFAALTWRFAEELAAGSNPIGRWLALAIGAFWMVRAVLQVFYYSRSHWRGRPARTTAHILLLTNYTAFGVVYLWTALRFVGAGL